MKAFKIFLLSFVVLSIVGCRSSSGLTYHNDTADKMVLQYVDNSIRLSNVKSQPLLIKDKDGQKYEFIDSFQCFSYYTSSFGERTFTVEYARGKSDSLSVDVLPFPAPIITVAGLIPEEPVISLEKIKSLTEVNVESWNDLVDFEVVAFQLTYFRRGVVVIKSNSNKFNSQMLKELETFGKGTTLYISNIKVKVPSGEIIKGAPIQKIVY